MIVQALSNIAQSKDLHGLQHQKGSNYFYYPNERNFADFTASGKKLYTDADYAEIFANGFA